MKTTLIFIAACAISTMAAAQDYNPPANPWLPITVGLHLVSHHLDVQTMPNGQAMRWNNQNAGVYARWANGLTIGTLRNSVNNQSIYVA